jgi:hypothetical protein
VKGKLEDKLIDFEQF